MIVVFRLKRCYQCEKAIPERNSYPKITNIYIHIGVLQRDNVFRLKIILKLANVKKRFQNEIQISKLQKSIKIIKVLQRDRVFRLKIVLKLANVKKRFQNEIQIPKLQKSIKVLKFYKGTTYFVWKSSWNLLMWKNDFRTKFRSQNYKNP